MRSILDTAVVAFVFGMAACTKYDFVDTGTANGIHNTTMWEYFHKDAYNWDSLIVMVRHVDRSLNAEVNLQELFEGKSKYQDRITFFGITNHSIRRYLLQNEYERITDIPAGECYAFILSSVLDEAVMLDHFMAGRPSTDIGEVMGTGGKEYQMLSGKKLWIYTFRSDYEGVPEAGPVQIHIVSGDTQKQTDVASSDIVTKTGIVHSLSYDFTLNDF